MFKIRFFGGPLDGREDELHLTPNKRVYVELHDLQPANAECVYLYIPVGAPIAGVYQYYLHDAQIALPEWRKH